MSPPRGFKSNRVLRRGRYRLQEKKLNAFRLGMGLFWGTGGRKGEGGRKRMTHQKIRGADLSKKRKGVGRERGL